LGILKVRFGISPTVDARRSTSCRQARSTARPAARRAWSGTAVASGPRDSRKYSSGCGHQVPFCVLRLPPCKTCSVSVAVR
jgi:hypothetical protein